MFSILLTASLASFQPSHPRFVTPVRPCKVLVSRKTATQPATALKILPDGSFINVPDASAPDVYALPECLFPEPSPTRPAPRSLSH